MEVHNTILQNRIQFFNNIEAMQYYEQLLPLELSQRISNFEQRFESVVGQIPTKYLLSL